MSRGARLPIDSQRALSLVSRGPGAGSLKWRRRQNELFSGLRSRRAGRGEGKKEGGGQRRPSGSGGDRSSAAAASSLSLTVGRAGGSAGGPGSQDGTATLWVGRRRVPVSPNPPPPCRARLPFAFCLMQADINGWPRHAAAEGKSKCRRLPLFLPSHSRSPSLSPPRR